MTISQAMVYAANGQRDKAEALYLRHRQTEGLSHTDIFVEGRYLAMTDRYDEAIRLYRQSDSIYRAAGGSLGFGESHTHVERFCADTGTAG